MRATTAVGVFFFGVLCAPGATAQSVEVSDSAGIEIVVSGPTDRAAPSRMSLSAQPLLTIGAIDGAEPYLFTQIWDAVRMRDGRLVVVEATAHDIRVFDDQGRHLTTFGGQGGGPEEFGGPPWIEVTEDETLLVWDPGHYRISRYSLDGELLDQESLRERIVELGITPFPNGRIWSTTPAGDLLWRGRVRERPNEGVHEERSRILRIDREAGDTDLGIHPSGQMYWFPAQGGGFYGVPSSFAAVTFSTLDLEGHVWINHPQRYELLRYNADGTLTRIARNRVPRLPVTPDLVQAARDQLPEMARGLGQPLRRIESAFEELPVPDDMPGYGALLRGADGRLWAARRQGIMWTRKPYGVYDVFEPSGAWVGAIELPARAYELLYADASHAIVAMMDEFDVQYVQLYALEEGR